MYKGRYRPLLPLTLLFSSIDALLDEDGEKQDNDEGTPPKTTTEARGITDEAINHKMTVRASADRYYYFANKTDRPLGYWRIPVTDIILLERVNSGETGERSRVRDKVFVKGVCVRFIINMAASTSVVGAMYDAKIQSDPVAVSNGVNGRPGYFTMGAVGAVIENVWTLLSTDGVGMVTEDGPFEMWPGGHGVSLDSPDESLHYARVKKMHEGGPIGEAQWKEATGERKGKVFKQDFQSPGSRQLGPGRFEEKYVEVYFEVGEWFEYSLNDGGLLEFERPLEIVMGVRSIVMDENCGRIYAGNVTGVMVDVYYQE
jgi:hypothetical protein